MEHTIPRYELRKLQSDFPSVTIKSSEGACDFIKQFYGDDIEIFESSFILLLNRANATIGYAKISQGGLTGTVMDPRLIAKYAVESLAVSIILAHNHPSGNLNPSQQDIDITKKIKEGLKMLDINVFDHIILSSTGYYSLLENGLM
jgi:DNA repair protein RadC